ncbi:MAG: hypothetical protein V8Q79_03860 [Christensenellales bacterium]
MPAGRGFKIGEDVLFNFRAFDVAKAWRMTEKSVYLYDYGGDSAMTRANLSVYENAKPDARRHHGVYPRKGLPNRLAHISTSICARCARIAGRGVLRSPLTARSSHALRTA